MSEVPDDSVSELETMRFEDWVESSVEWNDFPVDHVIAHLPAERSCWVQDTHTLRNHSRLTV